MPVPPPPPSPFAPVPRVPRHRRGARVMIVVGLVAGLACRSEGPLRAARAHPPTDGRRPSPPLALPDPGVGPGGCRLVTYTATGAPRPQVAELCRPAADQRDVAVVVVHGGGGIMGTYEGMRAWAARYRAEGYVTVLPEYHLFTPGSAERPVFPEPERDIKAAVQYVRGVAGALGVRGDRVVVQGHSAGARVGAVAFTTPDDPWFDGPERRAGLSDALDAFIGFYHPYDGTMDHDDQYFGGGRASADVAVRDRRDHGDSLARAAAASGPALFVAGGDDWDLIVVQQDEFAAVLRARGIEARTTVIAGGGHGFDEGGVRLSLRGERAAVVTLGFLNDVFPQSPPRPAQSRPVDLANVVDWGGWPATVTTAAPRTRPRR
jgi:acetyl esterase/lipase